MSKFQGFLYKFSKNKEQHLRKLAEKTPLKAIPLLIQELKGDSREMRKVANELLANIKEQGAIKPLLKAIEDDVNFVRLAAAEALGSLGNAKAIPHLIKTMCEDTWDETRKSAARALGQIGDSQAWNQLLEALEQKSLKVRVEAVKALAKIELEKAVKSITAKLNSEKSIVRQYVAEAIGKAKVESLTTPLLTLAISETDTGVLKATALSLKEIDNKEVVATLVRNLQEASEKGRGNIVYILGKVGDKDTAKELAKLLDDKDPQIRTFAASSLGGIENCSADIVSALQKALRDDVWDVREAAAESLSTVDKNALVAGLKTTILHRDQKTRTFAVKVLSNLKTKEAVSLVAQVIKDDPDEAVQKFSASTLGKIADEQTVSLIVEKFQMSKDHKMLKPFVASLLEKMINGDEKVFGWMLKLVEKMSSEDIVDQILDTLNACADENSAYETKEVLKKVITTSQNADVLRLIRNKCRFDDVVEDAKMALEPLIANEDHGSTFMMGDPGGVSLQNDLQGALSAFKMKKKEKKKE